MEVYNRWPFVLQPCFYIEICSNCDQHSWRSLKEHKEIKYIQAAIDLKHGLIKELPQLEGFEPSKVLINRFHKDLGKYSLVCIDDQKKVMFAPS